MNSDSIIQKIRRRITRIDRDRKNRRNIQKNYTKLSGNSTKNPDQRPVIFFNASTRLGGISLNAAFSILAEWAVKLQGAPTIRFVCQSGMSYCVLGTTRQEPARYPPCRECIKQSLDLDPVGENCWMKRRKNEELEAAINGLSLEQLTTLVFHDQPLGELVLPSLRWILRRHHLPETEAVRRLCREYIISAWNVLQEFGALLDEAQPQTVVVFNGMFYPEAAARRAALQRGIRVVAHEVGLQPRTGFFTTGEATAYPIDIPAEFEMTAEQNQRLDVYLKDRFQGNFSMAGIRFWPEMQNSSEPILQRSQQFKQIVPVFTNVVFDTSQGHANTVFPHMFKWLDTVLEIIKKNPDTFFVIRAHPDETRPGKESLESVADWVKQHQVDKLPNTMFVDSREFLSSYELIRQSKFVMVYNSTIGLEASLMGVPVLCGGRARFTQLPTVFFPQSQEEFIRQAEAFLETKDIVIPEEFTRNARRFLYYQLFRTSLPFDEFIEEDSLWKGYVRLKVFDWQKLLPKNSPTMEAVINGILSDGDFLLKV